MIREILCIYGVMKLSKEFRFFTYLLESYAQHKNTTAAIENAYMDLDSLIATGKPAW